MQLTVRLISKLLLGLLLVSCASSKPPAMKTKNLSKPIYQKVFYFSYDQVWRAAQLALKYPIAVNNMDHGVLETDFTKADDGFFAPGKEPLPSAGIRYKIAMVMAKGRVEGRDGVRVTINKVIEKKRDFFSDPENLISDGLEEQVLFYRMERELVIEEALKKAAKSGNS